VWAWGLLLVNIILTFIEYLSRGGHRRLFFYTENTIKKYVINQTPELCVLAVPLDKKVMEYIDVPCPPLETERRIVAALDEQCALIDAAIRAYSYYAAALSEYKTRLIADVVTGAADVRGLDKSLGEVIC
jgi:hypothetical protein